MIMTAGAGYRSAREGRDRSALATLILLICITLEYTFSPASTQLIPDDPGVLQQFRRYRGLTLDWRIYRHRVAQMAGTDGSHATCANMCTEEASFTCRSFEFLHSSADSSTVQCLWSDGSPNTDGRLAFLTRNDSVVTYMRLDNECDAFMVEALPEKCPTPLGMKRDLIRVFRGSMVPVEIADAQITASSGAGASYAPSRGRYDGQSCWKPRESDSQPWIQVDFDRRYVITGLVLQGCGEDELGWVQTFKVSSRTTGNQFVVHKERTTLTEELKANVEPRCGALVTFDPWLYANSIRVLPISWYISPGLRFEILGCLDAGCDFSLGITDHRLGGSPFTSSSVTDGASPTEARIQPLQIQATPTGGWKPRTSQEEWIQIRFPETRVVRSVITQGCDASYMADFTFSFSSNADEIDRGVLRTWNYPNSDQPLLFPANSDDTTLVRNDIPGELRAIVVRITPGRWAGDGRCMKFELIGCQLKQCDQPMNIGSREGAIQVEGSLKCLPTSFAIHGDSSGNRAQTLIGYPAVINVPLTVPFGGDYTITAVVTQGSVNDPQYGPTWANKYTLQYAREGHHPYTHGLQYYLNLDGSVRVFAANFDSITPVTNHLLRPVAATRLVLTYFNDDVPYSRAPCIRVDFLGCRIVESGPLCGPVGVERGGYCIAAIPNKDPESCSSIFHATSYPAIINSPEQNSFFNEVLEEVRQPGYDLYYIGLRHTPRPSRGVRFQWADGTPLMYSLLDASAQDSEQRLCPAIDVNDPSSWQSPVCDSPNQAGGTLCQFDLDECRQGTSGCPKWCTNYPGGFACQCPPGEFFRSGQCVSLCSLIGLGSPPFPNKCYKIHREPDQYDSASVTCEREGGLLVSQPQYHQLITTSQPDRFRPEQVWLPVDKIHPDPNGAVLCGIGVVNYEPPLSVDLRALPCTWTRPFICVQDTVPTVVLQLSEEMVQTNVTSDRLYIKWMGLPPWYDQLKQASLNIRVASGLVISFKVLEIDLRQGRLGECLDRLHITEHLPSGTNEQWSALCGRLPAFDILTNTNHVDMALNIGPLDVRNTQSHLSVQLFFEARDCQATRCDFVCTSESTPITEWAGPIATFHFPSRLPPAYSCRWTIIADPDRFIMIHFRDTRIQGDHPIKVFLRKINGSLVDEGRYEAVTKPIWLYSETNKVIITYETGVIHRADGFYAYHRPTAGPFEAPGCEVVPRNVIGSCPKTSCNLPKAYISTPNFPAMYSSSFECQYEIRTAPGSHIWVHIIYIESLDGVQPCDGSAPQILIQAFGYYTTICPSGRGYPPYISQRNELTMKFQLKGGRGAKFLAAYEEKYFETPEYDAIQGRDEHFSCPDTWKLFNGRCLKLITYTKNLRWTDALHHCRTGVGNYSELVSIRNTAEMNFIQEILVKSGIENDPCYIGLTSDSTTGRYEWSDGLPLSYSDWYLPAFQYEQREPNGGRSEGCTAIELRDYKSTQNWFDIPCADPMTANFVCAQPATILDSEVGTTPEVTFHVHECPPYFYRIADRCLRIIYYDISKPNNASGRCQDGTTIVGRRFAEEHLDELSFYHTKIWRLPDWHHVIIDETSPTDPPLCLRTQGAGLEPCERRYQRIVVCMTDASVIRQECREEQFQCLSGECIHRLYVNDAIPDCMDASDEGDNSRTSTTDLERSRKLACSDPSFMRCRNGQCIQASLFCDYHEDCSDGSDERDCVFPGCKTTEFTCTNGQCIPLNESCDLMVDCRDGSDEEDCDGAYQDSVFQCYSGTSFPGYLYCDGYRDCSGKVFEDEPESCAYFNRSYSCDESTQFECNNEVCADRNTRCMMDEDVFGIPVGCRDVTHLRDCDLFECTDYTFKCPDSYCIPQHFRCNGRIDCPGREDEADCESYTCEDGAYRCHRSRICLSQHHVCDGIGHCPGGDDELYCGFDCPPGCSCTGASFTCPSVIWDHLSAAMVPEHVKQLLLPYLKIRGRSRRALEEDGGSIFDVTYIDVSKYPLLLSLDLSGNGIRYLGNTTFSSNRNLQMLNLSYNEISSLDAGTFIGLDSLRILDLRENTELNDIRGAPFHNLGLLLELYLQGTSLETSDPKIVQGLTSIRTFHSDRFYYCCLLEDFEFVEDCLPAQGDFSSCTDLIRDPTLRYAIWILGMSALCGNLAVIMWRVIRQGVMRRQRKNPVQTLLVLNLAGADFLMGCYMLFIAAADVHFRDTYAIYSDTWQTSFACRFAGFLSTLSSVSSVMFLTVISLDRFHNVVFPFSRRHLRLKSCIVVSVCVWVVVMLLGILPAVIYGGAYYGRSSVCLALPITAQRLDGWGFSFAVFIGLNLLLFLIIVSCYVGIFIVAYKSSKTSRNVSMSDEKLKQEQLQMAAKVAFLVGTDFICWLPIITMGFLALTPSAVSGEVYAWTAVFILPINSSLNPYLYTFLVERASAPKAKGSAISRQGTESTQDMPMIKSVRQLPPQDSTKVSSEVCRTALNTLRMTRVLGPLYKEAVKSMTLSSILAKPGFLLPAVDREDVIRDIGKGLEHMHKRGITHGEVTEEYVVIDESSYGNKRAFLLMKSSSPNDESTNDSNRFEDDTSQLRELANRLTKLAGPSGDDTNDERV